MNHVLMVTDEPFLPARNGSQKIYEDTLATYIAQGTNVSILSFCKSASQIDDKEIKRAYDNAGIDYLLVPGWSAGRNLISRCGVFLREIDRTVRGNIFSTNPLINLDERFQLGLNWVKQRPFETVHFHKVHSVLLSAPYLKYYTGKKIVEVHDDFVEREGQYKKAYQSNFSRYKRLTGFRRDVRGFIRYMVGRTNLQYSTKIEIDILKYANSILISSQEEFEKYSSFPEIKNKLQYSPWSLSKPALEIDKPENNTNYLFDFGFIASDDIMNQEALFALRDEILPRIRQLHCYPKLLIAGSVASKASDIFRGEADVYLCSKISDIRSFYSRVNVSLAPIIFGTGVSIKVLEALSFGKTVICTEKGARGIPQNNRLVVCRDWQQYAEAAAHSISEKC